MSTTPTTTQWAEEKEIPNPDGPRGDLPLVYLPTGDQSITEAAMKLFGLMAKSGRFFVRGGRAMKLKKRDDGLFALEILDPEEARSDFEKVAQLAVQRVGANGEKVFKNCVCSKDIAKALLYAEEVNALRRSSLPPTSVLAMLVDEETRGEQSFEQLLNQNNSFRNSSMIEAIARATPVGETT